MDVGARYIAPLRYAAKLIPPNISEVTQFGGFREDDIGALFGRVLDRVESDFRGGRRLVRVVYAGEALHLAGERDYPSLVDRVKRPDYVLLGFTNEFGAALAACDLGLARAGGSVWELAAAGKPAVLVPFPYATADHQAKNARYFADGGGAVAVPESELERVPDLLLELLNDQARLETMSKAMLALARPKAADEIAEELIALARRRSGGGKR